MRCTRQNNKELMLHIDSLTDAELAEYKRVFKLHLIRLVAIGGGFGAVGSSFTIHSFMDEIREGVKEGKALTVEWKP